MVKRFFKYLLVVVVATTQAFFVFTSNGLNAQTTNDFDYNYIISDEDLFDYQSMDLTSITEFLSSRASTLVNYRDPITNLPAPQIIFRTAQDFQISPKFLLVLMQKEQSLIESNNPSTRAYNWATGYGVCDGCSTDDPLIQKFRGFYNQVYNAGRRIREDYLTQLANSGRTIAGFAPGLSKTVDNLSVTPSNKATAILFTYTPHLNGNKLFGTLWNKYFARKYPDGTVLNVEGDKYVWLIQDGQRRRFANRAVFLSRYTDFSRVVTINRIELLKYAEGSLIKFPNYAYVKVKGGATYLVVNDTVRVFANREAMRKVGVNSDEIINITAEDLVNYTEGEPITINSIYPLGSLVKTKAGDLWWLQDGQKHQIPYVEIAKLRYGKRKAVLVTKKQLDKYETSDPLLFPEGVLLSSKNDANIYLISNSTRRRFSSHAAFTDLGYDSKNVIVVSDSALVSYPLAELIDKSY